MPYDDETHKNLAMSYRDMGGTDKPLEAAKEMVSVLTWLREHPSMHLNTGHLLTVRCPQDEHTLFLRKYTFTFCSNVSFAMSFHLIPTWLSGLLILSQTSLA